MARPKQGKTRHAVDPKAPPLFVRGIPAAVLSELDQWASDLAEERGSTVSRTDVVRELIHRGLRERRAQKALAATAPASRTSPAVPVAAVSTRWASVEDPTLPNWRSVIAKAMTDKLAVAWLPHPIPDHHEFLRVRLPNVLVEASGDMHFVLEVELRAALQEIERRATSDRDGLAWMLRVLAFGSEALVWTIGKLIETTDLAATGRSRLGVVADMFGRRLRRSLLFNELQVTGWNLAHCSERLSMGSAANVLRLVKELDLTDEFEAAKKAGRVLGRGRRTREENEVDPLRAGAAPDDDI